LIIVICGYFFEWKWTGFPQQTFWDWLKLLIVPAVLAIGGYLFARSERQATEAAAERRAQDEALQAYLDQMGQLLLDPDTPLRKSEANSEVRILALAQTLTVLTRLGGNGKARLLQFLYESRLIDRDDPIVALGGADLREADLRWAYLSNADLRQARLSQADLRRANLEGANLRGGLLSEADLHVATLIEADLRGVNWRDTDLRNANLSGAKEVNRWMLKEQIRPKFREGTTLPDRQTLKSKNNPDGPTFEEWYKQKESGKEAGEKE
jgi:hypothetical protein